MMASAPPETDCAAVLRLVRQRAGLAFDAGRLAAAEATVRRAMARAGITESAAYCRQPPAS